ncbi:MAG: hypothetical protein LBU38_04490 [Propionibacteriaceae bacterium]|jgi:hypothetical protein|nr:hypothetical protein [Propionibacteriaceae bacterium]
MPKSLDGSGQLRTTVGAPQQPFPNQVPDPVVSVDDFAPPRPKAPWLVGLGLLLVGVVISWFALGQPGNIIPTPDPVPSASAGEATPTWGLPFTISEHRQGRWEVIEHEWTAQGLEVNIRLRVEKGPLSVDFRAYDNSALESSYQGTGNRAPAFPVGEIAEGDEQSGWVFFQMRRGDATLILTDLWGSQISALPIPG